MRMTQLMHRISPWGLKLNCRDWVAPVEDDIIPTSLSLPHTTIPRHPTLPLLICEAVIPEPYPSAGLCLSSYLSCRHHAFPQHLPVSPLSGWHHELWQETKSVSGHRCLACKGRPWQLSINLPRLFFFFSSFLFLISEGRRWNPAVSITGAY